AANQIDALRKAIASYRLDVGRFPRQEDGLQALVVRPGGEARWQGPYLQRGVPMDPWGNPYVYRVPGAFGDYEVLSLGRDGKPGGEGEDADIGGGGRGRQHRGAVAQGGRTTLHSHQPRSREPAGGRSRHG